MKNRNTVLLLLVVFSAITYLDRICIAVAGPRMQQDLGISPSAWGWVLGIFLIPYGALEIPMGALGDRIGQRKVLTRIVLCWSLFTGLTGLAASLPLLLLTRFLFGAGEAGAYPNASGSIARWFPQEERGKAQGLVWAASRLGGALAPLMIIPAQQAFGWRLPFGLLAVLGCVWALVWHRWYRDRPALLSSKIGATALPPAAAPHSPIPWKALAKSRQIWRLAAMYWFYVWGSVFYLSWFHTYLVKGRGFSEAGLARYAALPFLAGMLGNIAGGFISDWLTRQYGPRVGRTYFGALCLTLSSFLLAGTALTKGKTVGVVLLTAGFGSMDCMLPAAWALCLDIGQSFAGAVTGAMNSAGQFGGFLCSIVFGYFVEWTGSYNLPLLLIAAMVFIGALLFLTIDPQVRIAFERKVAV